MFKETQCYGDVLCYFSYLLFLINVLNVMKHLLSIKVVLCSLYVIVTSWKKRLMSKKSFLVNFMIISCVYIYSLLCLHLLFTLFLKLILLVSTFNFLLEKKNNNNKVNLNYLIIHFKEKVIQFSISDVNDKFAFFVLKNSLNYLWLRKLFK